jgi:hypothetical protein
MNNEFISFEDENQKAFEVFMKSDEGQDTRYLTYSEDGAELGFLAGCEYKDKKYSYMSATQCVHQEALDVEEGFDGVICRKHLKILELEKELKGVNPFTGCKCKLYEETARVNLEAQLKKAEDRRDFLQREYNKLLEAAEDIMYQFKRYTESSSDMVKDDIKKKYFNL